MDRSVAQPVTRRKAVKDLQVGDRVLTTAGFITISDVRVYQDGAVEVIYPSLGQMLAVETVVGDDCTVQVTIHG